MSLIPPVSDRQLPAFKESANKLLRDIIAQRKPSGLAELMKRLKVQSPLKVSISTWRTCVRSAGFKLAWPTSAATLLGLTWMK